MDATPLVQMQLSSISTNKCCLVRSIFGSSRLEKYFRIVSSKLGVISSGCNDRRFVVTKMLTLYSPSFSEPF